jgi:hypothetical protein
MSSRYSPSPPPPRHHPLVARACVVGEGLGDATDGTAIAAHAPVHAVAGTRLHGEWTWGCAPSRDGTLARLPTSPPVPSLPSPSQPETSSAPYLSASRMVSGRGAGVGSAAAGGGAAGAGGRGSGEPTRHQELFIIDPTSLGRGDDEASLIGVNPDGSGARASEWGIPSLGRLHLSFQAWGFPPPDLRLSVSGHVPPPDRPSRSASPPYP